MTVSLIFIFLTISLIRCYNLTTSDDSRIGILIIPGLGRTDRLKIVTDNFVTLGKDFFSLWDCMIYIYADHSSFFWDNRDSVQYLRSICNIIENPNKLVNENLHNVEPYLIRNTYKYVFILLDDCQLQVDFHVQKFINIMEYNKLTLASPRVIGANRGGGQNFRRIMELEPRPGTAGYVSVFTEMFALIMTIPAYKAFWELLCPSVNPYGWGYDMWYEKYAKSRVVGHKMGVISAMNVIHRQNLTGLGRTDTTSVDIKWKAVRAQEKFYNKYHGVNLHHCRSNMGLRNTSVTGAAIGFLHYPPNF